MRSLLALSPRWLQPACAVCALAPGPVCAACEEDYFPASRLRCPVCAIGMPGTDAECGRCISTPPAFARTVALGDYAPPVDGMVMALKFGARLDLAAVFGRLLAVRAAPARDTLVVPAPLAWERLAERGFNQSLQIARAYCAETRCALRPELLRRVRHTPPQQALALDERRRNIRGAFHCAGDVSGRTVTVIDDVMTSGSTMDEIARTLRTAGAAEVHALVVARTP